NLTATRTNKDTAAPVLDQYERLRDAYAPIAGDYYGQYKGSNESFGIRFNIMLTDVIYDTGKSFIACPILRGQYHPLFKDQSQSDDMGGGIGVLVIDVAYFPWNSR